MEITTIGIDLAKNIFQTHGVDEHVDTPYFYLSLTLSLEYCSNGLRKYSISRR